MKKLISIALAAAMLAAVSVPAFAANPITKETEQTGTTIMSHTALPQLTTDVATKWLTHVLRGNGCRR